MTRVFLLLALALSACAPLALPPQAGVEPGPAMPAADTCGAGPYAGLIGQPATALERVLILRQVRVIRPGDAVTMDFREDRINFLIDGSERIARITCG